MTAVAPPRAPLAAPRVEDVGRPLLVELIGLAGAGKTTLVRALVDRIPGARAGLRLDRTRDIPAIALAAGRVTPALFVDLLRGSGTAAHDARYSLRLLAHRSAARRALRAAGQVVLVDEGPVYMLTRLAAFGSASGDRSGFRRQWERNLDWWRDRLDAIVWLDAPNDVLAARIRARAKHHRAKETSDDALSEFLARYRVAYSAVVERITVCDGPQVIQLDSRQPLEAEIDRLLSSLRLISARRPRTDS
jgi:thymidylate kinase